VLCRFCGSLLWSRAVLPSRCGDSHMGYSPQRLWLEQSVALCLVLEVQIL
jgi:hypothetical protein